MDTSIETNTAQAETNEQEPCIRPGAAKAPKGHVVGVQLLANGQPDVPMLANFARVQMSATAVVLDFGFLEPDGLNALSRMAGKGEKMPAAIKGRLAARIALEPEALASLYRQLGQTIARVSAARKGNT